MFRFFLLMVFLVSACTNKKDDPLILPPNFAEKPDPSHPEKPSEEQRDENLARLKDLLLKSDE